MDHPIHFIYRASYLILIYQVQLTIYKVNMTHY